jgi:hypothetical protein
MRVKNGENSLVVASNLFPSMLLGSFLRANAFPVMRKFPTHPTKLHA